MVDELREMLIYLIQNEKNTNNNSLILMNYFLRYLSELYFVLKG